MKKIILVFLFLVVPFATCVYAAYLDHAAGDSAAAWFFIAFGLLFGIPLVSIVVKMIGRRVPWVGRFYHKVAGVTEEPKPSRFVPHWFVMTLLGVLGAVVLFRIIMNIVVRMTPVVTGS